MKKLLLLLSSIVCLVLGNTSAVRAQFIPDPAHVYAIINHSTGQALEIGGGGNLHEQGIRADMWGYWGGANQQWMFQNVGGGYYAISNRNSRQQLTVLNPYGSPRDSYNGQPVHQRSYAGPTTNNSYYAQYWKVTDNNGSNYIEVYSSRTFVPFVLTSNSDGQVFEQVQFYLGGTPPANYQQGTNQWDIYDVSANPGNVPTAGVYQIVNVNSGKALTVEPGDDYDRSIKQMPAWGLACEEWTFVPGTASGYYRIVNRRNYLCLEIGGGSQANGADVNLWEYYQHPWQEWAFLEPSSSRILTPQEFMDGREVVIYSRHAGKLLENGGAMNDGARAYMWNAVGQPWQRWRLQLSGYNRYSRAGSTATPAVAVATTTLSLYPNPATDRLSVMAGNGLDLATASARVVDASGRAVTVPYQAGQLDVSNLAAGLYILELSDGQHVVRQKFTKQ